MYANQYSGIVPAHVFLNKHQQMRLQLVFRKIIPPISGLQQYEAVS